jgi:uncharacterized tellurite resistance protein B-like protein
MPRWVIFAVLCLPAVAVAVVFIRYRMSPVGQWVRRVRRRRAELDDRLAALSDSSRREASPAERLAEVLFHKQRQNVPAAVLTQYPDIGPKTIEWLANAGITNLLDAEAHVSAFFFKKKIDNLGEAREAALKHAVHEQIRAERARFDAGSSVEGAEYRTRLAALSAEEQAKATAIARERAALTLCIDRLSVFEAAADRVSMTGWLLGAAHAAPGEIMQRPLPEVDATIDLPSPPMPKIESVPNVPPPSASSTASPSDRSPHPQLALLGVYGRVGWAVAKADGRMAASERSVIREYLAGRFGGDAVLLRHIDPQMERIESEKPDLDAAIAEVHRIVPKGEHAGLYEFASRVAEAAGPKNAREEEALVALAQAFGIAISEPVNAPPESPPTAEPVATASIDPRTVLEIPVDAEITADLVRRRYAMAMETIARGKALGGDFARVATEKESAVRSAAESLMATLGEPLVKPAAEPPSDLRHNPELDDLFK